MNILTTTNRLRKMAISAGATHWRVYSTTHTHIYKQTGSVWYVRTVKMKNGTWVFSGDWATGVLPGQAVEITQEY